MGRPEHNVSPEILPRRPGYPLVVASLPGRDAEALREQAGAASEAGADLVEIRLDRLRPQEIPRLERMHEIPIMHPWVPAIATLRSMAEGGEGPNDLSHRRKLLAQALESVPFSLVDLELARDLPLRQELSESFGRPVARVVSAHLPAPTSTPEVFRTLRAALDAGDVGKVVLPASALRILQELLPGAREFEGRPFVLHTTGGAGGLLRVLAGRLRMAWVYGRPPVRSAAGARPVPEGVEPSQLPVGALRRFIDEGPEAPWFALLGNPLGHTLSPDLHDAFFEATKAHGIYLPLEITSEEELRRTLPDLLALGLEGVNVTRPWKTAAYGIATRRSEHASASGAANTLIRIAGSPPGLFAHNTDVDALLRWWKELEGEGVELSPMLVVGTGGAARAAVLAGVLGGAQVGVVGRQREASQELVRDFPQESVRAIDAKDLRPYPLVVHATPVGQQPGSHLEVDLGAALASGSLLVDLVYRPRESTLRDLARSRGARYTDGMRMLVYQAAESFHLFTGCMVPEPTLVQWTGDPAGVPA